ncbi:MAG: TonB-dependent receptor [Bacteroidetes bacterium]|nr:TonB-dependent receptor [Bacteroidota bacterium]
MEKFFSSKIRKLLIITLFLFFTKLIIASSDKKEIKNGKTINFKVTVLDSVKNTPLELVTLILKKGNKIVNVKETDHFGSAIFSDVAIGKYTLISQYVGYNSYSNNIILNQNHKDKKVLLQESAINLQEVVVTGNKENHVSSFTDIKTGIKTFELETFHPSPEARMTSVIQENLTGAVRAPTGEVHIRGQHGEFTYLIDEIPIPLGVFGGLNETVDPGVIKNISFFTGGFPAEYGGQTAAIIDVRTQVPPGKFQLNLSSYAGSYLTSNNQDLGSNVGSFKSLNSNGQSLSLSNHLGSFGYFFSGSRSETDRRIDQPVIKLFNDHGFDYFLYGKMDYFLSESDYLTTNLNYSETKAQIPFDPGVGINFDTQDSYNSFQTLSYYHTFTTETDKSSELFAGLFLREGGLKFNTSPLDQTLTYINNDSSTGYTVNQNRNFVTYGTRIKYSDELSHQFEYAVGLESSVTDGKENFKFNNINGNGPANNTNFTGSDFSVFAQTNIHPLEWTRIEAGLRYDQHIAPIIQKQTQLNPRLKLSFFPDDFSTVYLSYDKLFIPTNIEGLSSVASAVGDSSSATFPEKDNLYEVGIIHNFLNGLNAKLDYFYKDSSPGLDDQTLGSSTIRVNVNISQVKVSGIELSLTYNDPSNPLSGYLNGSLMHAYGIGPVSGGFLPPNSSTTPFDLDHDQRLSVVVGLNYQPQNWYLNLVGIYGSGLTNGINNYTFKTGLFEFNQAAHTTPSWIFNLSGGYIFPIGSGSTIEPSISITNLLDHEHLLKGAFFSSASFEERRNIIFKISYHL